MLNKLYEQGKDLHVANYMAYGKTADHKLYADATFKETVTKEEIEDSAPWWMLWAVCWTNSK